MNTHTQPAAFGPRAAAIFLDTALLGCAATAISIAMGADPIPDLAKLGLVIGGGMSVWFLQRYLLGVTVGQRIWDLHAKKTSKHFFAPLLQRRDPKSITLGLGSFLTVLSWIGLLALSYTAVAVHPLGQIAIPQQWEAFLPPLDAGDEETPAKAEGDRWSVYPFYYSLGAWPRVYKGKDVFFNLPYEKGPPDRFVGKIIARWDAFDTRLTLEGPKTPIKRDSKSFDRAQVEHCIVSFWSLPFGELPGCLAIRRSILDRHFEGLRQIRPDKISMQWIRVENRALPPQEQTQGILITGLNKTRGQDRFILITPNGTNQAFVLNYTFGKDAEYARETFKKALSSLRVSDELSPGRAWADQSIERIDLHQLQSQLSDTKLLSRLAEVQALLISRISVDPKLYDTYFHLGGTALLLARQTSKLRTQPGSDKNPEQLEMQLQTASQLTQSAFKFAQDVNAQDPRTQQLQSFWFEVQKM